MGIGFEIVFLSLSVLEISSRVCCIGHVTNFRVLIGYVLTTIIIHLHQLLKYFVKNSVVTAL